MNLYLKAVGNAFPNEVYYADLASDEIKLDKDSNQDDVIEIVLNLVNSMKELGLEKEQIEEKISAIEIPGYNKQILEKVFNNIYQANMNHKEKLLYRVLDALENNESSPDLQKLDNITRAFATGLSIADDISFTEDDLKDVSREAQTKFDIRMGLGSMFKAMDYAPWLTERQGAINWFFWNRYKMQLLKWFPPRLLGLLIRLLIK